MMREEDLGSGTKEGRMSSVLGFASILFSFALAGCVALEPSAKVRSHDQGPAALSAYQGPRARVAVGEFSVKAAKARGVIGEGLADMVATALVQTNRFIVLDPPKDGSTQGSGASTNRGVGQLAGAPPVEPDLLVIGTVTEFDAESSKVGGKVQPKSGSTPPSGLASLLESVAGSATSSHIAIDLRLVDIRTRQIVAATSVEGKAAGVDGSSAAGKGLTGTLSGHARTPMEKAVRIVIEEAVKFVVSNTPAQYLRAPDAIVVTPSPSQVRSASSPGPVTPPAGMLPAATPVVAPVPGRAAPTVTRETSPTLFVTASQANLRLVGSTTAKIMGVLPKGTRLAVLETHRDWYRVRLDDGREGWIAQSVTSPIRE
jgi:curli biogenesis system outer membrane secretion channel CsgG